jgi:hypothetical protein
VNSLASATERLSSEAAYLKALPAGLSRLFCAALLGRKDLPEPGEFAQLRRGLRFLIIGLASWVGVVGAATVLAVLWLQISTMSAPSWLGTRTSSVATVDAHFRSGFENILQRPLFSRSRKPIAVALARPVALVSPLPPSRDRNIKLKGVFLNGAIAKAFVTSTEAPSGSWVAINGEIGGWRIASVTSDQMVLNANEEKLVIPLTFDGPSHAGVAPATNAQPNQPIFEPRQNPN